MRRVLTALALGLATGLIVTACGRPPHPDPPERPHRTTTTTVSEPATTTTTAPAPPPTTSTTVRPAPAPVTTLNTPAPTPGDDPRCPTEITTLIHRYFDRFGTDVAAWATRIAWRESNCRPDVTSSSGCAGVLQLSEVHADLFTALGYSFHPDAWNAEANIAVAAALYASSGPSPWRL